MSIHMQVRVEPNKSMSLMMLLNVDGSTTEGVLALRVTDQSMAKDRNQAEPVTLMFKAKLSPAAQTIEEVLSSD